MRPAMAAFLVLLLSMGCGSASSPASTTSPTSEDPGSPAGSGGTSSLTVSLKDSPFSDARALLVTFSEVNVHASGGGWVTLPFAGGASSRTCDLKKLQAAQDILGVGALPAGHYTQLRMVVSNAAIYFDNASAGAPCAAAIAAPAGESADVDIPSGELKLNREFEIKGQAGTTILLDFDGDQSIHATGHGTFLMTPVVGIISVG